MCKDEARAWQRSHGNGWQTLNLNPHLFTEKTVNVPQSSLQKHRSGKHGARALDGNVNQLKGSR